MWEVVNIKTKEVVFKAATYKQCLNYLKSKDNKDQYTIRIG